jgi:hypothetical protein
MDKVIDCLIVRQPFASLIAYGMKRWEFRTYDCKKRGLIGIGSSRGNPLKTGDPYLNSISRSFPRGVALATAVLTDSFEANNEYLMREIKGQDTVTIHKHLFKVASAPIGEPMSDIMEAAKDKKWKMFIWVLKDVRPFKTFVPLQNNATGSTWTKITLENAGDSSESLDSFLQGDH